MNIAMNLCLEGEIGADGACFTPKIETQENGWQSVSVFNYATGRLEKFYRPMASMPFKRVLPSGAY